MTNSLGPVLFDPLGLELTSLEKEILTHPVIGGVVLFGRNYESPQQVIYLINSIRKIRSNIPVMVDQEGGCVQRFVAGFPQVRPMHKFGEAYVSEDRSLFGSMLNDFDSAMSELANLGVGVNFAPVLDLQDSKESFLYSRSISPNINLTVTVAEQLITIMHKYGLKTTLKHFPGHGQVLVDSHRNLPVDDRSKQEIEQSDMQPFHLLAKFTDAIMPAHVLYTAVDADFPASLSKIWLQQILRQEVGYKGVVISDDLNMSALAPFGSIPERSKLALEAGCDYLCVCNNQAVSVELIDYLHNKNDLINGFDGLASVRRENFCRRTSD